MGRPCEMEGCKNEAYKICDDEYLCFWKGCMKAVCVDHANVRTGKTAMTGNRGGGSRTVYAGFNCKDKPCSDGYNNASCKCISIGAVLAAIICLVVIIVGFIIPTMKRKSECDALKAAGGVIPSKCINYNS